jgi:hypothetical protein
MSNCVHRHLTRYARGSIAVLICTAISDIAVAIVAIANPNVAPVAVGTIVTLTTAGVAAAVPLARPAAK